MQQQQQQQRTSQELSLNDPPSAATSKQRQQHQQPPAPPPLEALLLQRPTHAPRPLDAPSSTLLPLRQHPSSRPSRFLLWSLLTRLSAALRPPDLYSRRLRLLQLLRA